MLKMQCHVHARLPARSWQRTLGHWAERRHLFLAREIQGEGHTCEKQLMREDPREAWGNERAAKLL